eukprot:TRINITY_DN19984_c0_g1_i1.p1 TRINITY_DN19984_c0_g1~~TRINITY_DN19984_c0_g1_i1.p1  ORF type:complete len:303 (+),score=68.99 TRINITY_DN19984_c0_g1_i1:49-909(+)
MTKNMGEALLPHLDSILELLVKGVVGRTWTGKESLLVALAAVAKIGKEKLDVDRQTELCELVLGHAKRRDKTYKRQAIVSLGDLLETFPQVDMFGKVFPLLSGIAAPNRKEKSSDSDSDSDDDDRLRTPKLLALQASSFKTISHAWPQGHVKTQLQWFGEYMRFLLDNLQHNWNIQIAVLSALQRVVATTQREPWSNEQRRAGTLLLQDMVQATLILGYEAKYASVRSAAIDVVAETVNKCNGGADLDLDIARDLTRAASDPELAPKIREILALLESPKKKPKTST